MFHVFILASSLIGQTDYLIVLCPVLNNFPVPNIVRIVYYPIYSLFFIVFLYSVGFLCFFIVFAFQIEKQYFLFCFSEYFIDVIKIPNLKAKLSLQFYITVLDGSQGRNLRQEQKQKSWRSDTFWLAHSVCLYLLRPLKQGWQHP